MANTTVTPGKLSVVTARFAPTISTAAATMALTIAGVDRTSSLKHGTLKIKSTADGAQGVLDCELIDFKPTNNDSITLTYGSLVLYDGEVRSVEVNEIKTGHYTSRIACQDDAAVYASFTGAPWAFSDTPDNTTTFAYESLKIKTDSVNSVATQTSGTVTTRKPGLLPGQVLTITSANHGLAAEAFNIVEIDVTFDHDSTPLYTIKIGNSPVRLADTIQSTVDTSVESAAEVLAAQLRAPKVVSVLPTLPDDDYIEGTLAYLTTDGKIYRSLGDTWSKEVDGADLLVSSITAGAIQAGAIGAEALAAEIVLASTIKTASSGRRVEISEAGVNLYDTDESPLVRVPTNGDPVYVKGEVNASSLISQTAAEFRTAASLATGTVMTAQNGVVAPINPPTIAASVDSLGLTSTPADVTTAAGIAYDSGAGTFWVAADPSAAGSYVAHEFNATTGAYVRSISATGSTTTTTTTLGSTSHVSDTAQATSGGTDSQVATPLTMPRDGRITKVSVYMAGYGGDCTAKVAVWNTSGTLLRESASFTATSRSFVNGNSDHYDRSLTSALTVTSGTTYRVGFLRTSTSDGFQWDRDDGSSKTTYRGDGEDGNLTGVSTDTTHKPNVYITYEYDTDTRLETVANIGVATDGTYVYTLDTNGVVWKYNRTTLAYVANSAALSLTGTKSLAGLFYDATATKLVITHATGTTGTDKVKFSLVDPSALTISSTLSDTTLSINGATAKIRGGCRAADPLNASAATYWVPVNGTVYAYLASTAANVANRDFGSSASALGGLTHDGTIFRGWATATPTKIWKYSAWDWTTASSIYWVAYAWYDSAGTTHETAISPRASLTLRRRERLQITTPAIPTGGADDPDKVRVYMKPNATDPGAGALKLQATDAVITRYLTDYASGGAADGGGTAFPAGGAAEIKSAATGWSLKGNGDFSLGMSKGSGSTSAQGSITTEVDLTGSSVTWTAVTGHTYLVLYNGSGISTVAGDVIVVRLKESTTTLDSIAIDVATGSRSSSSMSFYLATGLSAGSHTFKLSALRNNGTGTLTVTASLAVFDLGL